MIRRIHAVLAIVFALPLLLVSLSGAMLGFARESDRILHVDLVSAPFSSAPAQTMQTLRAVVQDRFPERRMVEDHPAKTSFDSTMFVMQDKLNQRHEVFIHTQTGEIRGSRPENENFYHQVHHIHTTLLLGETGRWITTLAALGLFLTALSGLILRRKAPLRSLSARLHPLLGVITAPVLLTIAISGLLMSTTPNPILLLQQLHSGEIFAMPGRVLWVLASLSVSLLVYGGIASYRNRVHPQ